MTWNYRIVRRTDGQHDLAEVHYNRAGQVCGLSGPATFGTCEPVTDAEARESISHQLSMALADVKRHPVLREPGPDEWGEFDG